MKNMIKSLSLGCLLATVGLSAFAQGTVFTYQGRLNNGTNPVTGTYDLKFQLYDSVTGGTLLGGPTTNTAVGVTNGLFTVMVDFGAGVFTGSSNWLHIQVRTNGSGAFTSLVPREQVTPTPYAIYAENANAAGLTGTVPVGDLSGVALLAGGNTFTGNQTINNSVLETGHGSGAGSHTDVVIGPGGYYPGEEHRIDFDDSSSPIGSLIVGYNNSGIGYFSIGNLYSGGYQSGTKGLTVFGNNTVGVGTTGNPQQYLSVHGGINVDQANINAGFINNGNTNGYGVTFGSNSGEGIASERVAGGNQYGLDFYTSFNQRMSIQNNGSIRIDGNPLLLEPSTSGVYANDGLYWGDPGLAGINYLNAGPWLAGYYGGALGALVPNVVALSWDSGGNCLVSNNISASTVSVRNNSTGASEYFYETGSSILASGEYLGVYGLGGVQPYIGDDGFGGDVQIGSLTHGITAVACYNATDGAYMHLYCSSITIEGGADLAEPFKITSGKDEVPQGAVVVIDEQNPGHLKMSDQDYDTHVAGVVSGANGVNPGIQMQQQGVLDGGKNVALTGRVYVQADTSNGAIKPGDLLTTSSLPGHAMKVTDHARAAGAILGKAMTGLSEGKGLVLVLVTLQ
jgi:hypothetical protein